jgi:hypothetical protein
MVTVNTLRPRRWMSLLAGRSTRVVLVPLLSLVAIGLFVLVAEMFSSAVARPRGIDMLPALRGEFASITAPSDAKFVQRPESSSKMGHALVLATYAYRGGYDRLRDHYDREAARGGWSVCGEKPLYDWFRDLGGRSRSYCKGDLQATLQFAGAGAHYGWDYAFSVSWGLD